MNITQKLYMLYWMLLKTFSPKSLRGLFLWGIQKKIFFDHVKKYKNLNMKLFGRDMATPIGIQSDISLDIATIDSLIQHGAGFGTFGSFIQKALPTEFQTMFFCQGRTHYILADNYAHSSLSDNLKPLIARRYLPHLTGISLLSFNAEESKGLGADATRPSYIVENEQMVGSIAPYCDFIVINVSHPSTCLYQLLSDESSLMPLLEAVRHKAKVTAPIKTPKILLKVPYDISDLEIKSISQLALKMDLSGIVVSGPAVYTRNRNIIKSKHLAEPVPESTFVYGEPIHAGVEHLIREFRKRTNGLIPLIASGTALTGKDVYDLICAGAWVVEVGPSFYLNGPKAFLDMQSDLSKLVKKAGVESVQELIGRSEPINPNATMADLLNS